MRGFLLVFVAVGLFVAAPAASAQTPTLYATVENSISLRIGSPTGPSVRNLPPGTYTILVADRATNHNFHLSGPGVDLATDIEEAYIGTRTWTATFVTGSYHFNCDRHTGLNGSFTVGDLLVVEKSGLGEGIVTSSPTGVDCGGACIVPFPWGTALTLTAVAARGSVFRGWSGTCTGDGACSVTVQGGTHVGALFERVGSPPTAAPRPAVALSRVRVTKVRGVRVVTVTLGVLRHAAVSGRLLRAGRHVVGVRAHVAPGVRTLRLRLPRAARGGLHSLRIRITGDGPEYVLRRSIRVPR